jgi:hypothetical protein
METDHDMEACIFMSFRGGRRNVENDDGKDKELSRTGRGP